ncbi:MAG: serine hydrolase domain-containing protein [Bryobacteraceae bacterium]
MISNARRDLLRRCLAGPLLALGACARRPPPVAFDKVRPQWAPEVEKRVLDSCARHSVPGVSLAVVRNGQLAWARGLGLQDRSSNIPVSTSTIFEAASMSKPVFAYAVMKLHERGILNLDTTLTSYSPERFLDGDPRLDLITARHVLSHTSGFQDIRSREHPLAIHFKPGDKWQYSGEGYAYLQAVMTRLTGHEFASPCGSYEMDLRVCATDFDSYMKAHVLGPLGMSMSGYVSSDRFAGYVARPHDERGEALSVRRYDAAGVARYGSMGGLLTTAVDYAKFLIAILTPRPGDAFHLRPATIAEMLAPQIKVEDGPGYSISWALGWKVAKTEKFGVLVSHGGDQSGFHSLAEMSPVRKSAYVILTNGDSGWKLIQELAPEMARRVHVAAG